MSVGLIDADIAAFRAAAAAQRENPFGGGHWADVGAAAASAVATVGAWGKLADCDEIIACFTGKMNFRKLILPSYKSNRSGAVKPVAYNACVSFVKKRYKTYTVDCLEADDLMGILATREKYLGRTVIVTLDKDLRTVPGLHMNPLKDKFPVEVSELEADRRWMTQTLTGDTSDGYKGLPGWGPAKAAKLLLSATSLAEMWNLVVSAYNSKGLSEADALIQARVARILRSEDFERDSGAVRLWSPTGTPTILDLKAKLTVENEDGE